MEIKKCNICHVGGYKARVYAIGACDSCKDVLSNDIHLLYRCAEVILLKRGYTLDAMYANNNKQHGVAARRMIAAVLSNLTHCTSFEIMNIFRLKGREYSDSTVRHLIMSSRDFYEFNKSYREGMDTYMTEVIEQYMLHDNMIKNSSLIAIDKVTDILIRSGITKDRMLASEVSLEILNVLR
jgi:hypothetical protein